MSGATVRDASKDDAPACAAIYAPYVRETAVSFESEPPTPAQMAERIAAATRTHAWIVHEDDNRVIGYAYGGPHQARAAYRFSCEVSVYVEQGRRRTGSGRALYEALFKRLAARDYRMAVAGMTLPNEASAGLHRAMGFEPVGVYRRIGSKFGVWHDVAWMQRALGVEHDPPPELVQTVNHLLLYRPLEPLAVLAWDDETGRWVWNGSSLERALVDAVAALDLAAHAFHLAVHRRVGLQYPAHLAALLRGAAASRAAVAAMILGMAGVARPRELDLLGRMEWR